MMKQMLFASCYLSEAIMHWENYVCLSSLSVETELFVDTFVNDLF